MQTNETKKKTKNDKSIKDLKKNKKTFIVLSGRAGDFDCPVKNMSVTGEDKRFSKLTYLISVASNFPISITNTVE